MDPASIIRRASTMYPDNIAVSFEGRDQTYSELFDRACRLANLLRSYGAEPGDRIAVLGDNAFETVEHAAACALGNFPRATLYTYHPPTTNRYLVELTGARVLLVQARYAAELSQLCKGLGSLKAIVIFGEGVAEGSAPSYEKLLAAASNEDRYVPTSGDDVHIIRFSSGTTGRPKGIYHSVNRWNQYNNEWRWVTPMLTEQSRYLVPTSLAHLGVAFLWGVLSVGGCIIPMPAFDPRRVLELLEKKHVTHAVAAPIMIREMLKDETSRNRDFSSLQCLMYAGSPIAPDTLRAAIEVFGPTLYQLYAQSEAMPITMLLPHQHVTDGTEKDIRRLRSVGRPTPNVEVTVRDADGAILPPGSIGEIAARSSFTMSGIWDDPSATALRTLNDGSILTRDMGYLDEDGFVYLVDRKDDMIVSGGFNIWPSELEEALTTHPAVSEVCVFGVPDQQWGETPMAAVVLRQGSQAGAEDLIAHTRKVVGGVKKVTRVEFLPSLPRTASGKVLRSVLKDPHWSERETKIAGS